MTIIGPDRRHNLVSRSGDDDKEFTPVKYNIDTDTMIGVQGLSPEYIKFRITVTDCS